MLSLSTNYNVGAIGLLAASALIAVFFVYLHSTKRRRYLLVWSWGWGMLVLHGVAVVLEPRLGLLPLFLAVSQFSMGAAALIFLEAARQYAGVRPWTRWLVAAAALLAVWTYSYCFGSFQVPPEYGTVPILLATAWVFWQESRRQGTMIDLLLAILFVCWVPIVLAVMHFGPVGTTSYEEFAVLGSAPQLLAAVLMVMAAHEQERRQVERDILALANLNLKTSSFVSGEIEGTLTEALDRVLSVAGLPAGAIFLRHGDSHGPAGQVSRGLEDSFCSAAAEGHLDKAWIELIARMGGLQAFRNLDRDPTREGSELDESFASLRALAVTHRLRTLIAVSLQVKDRPLGVLLLATPEDRRFAQSELQLLQALSHQIAVAVENSHLIQQTSRRSEEMRVLNEIGRALSSTLDLEALFVKIFQALQSMLDVRNFSIALHDAARNQLCYELEIADGVQLPKRSRRAGNHLAEYMLHTGQPVLIRKNVMEEAARLGVTPAREAKSFCGVPLVACERAIGVMLVYSQQEEAFDEEHLAMMSVLASEASIAIENARLFHKEQTKSKQLTLLNNISRNAIATLNPDHMLASIAEQFEGGLAFDHIGIGLLDYVHKEVAIQVESGRRRGAVGRRLGLEGSLVGWVARSGRITVVRDLGENGRMRPVLEDSASAIALPLFVADQLHGVLYVETAETTDFSEEEIQLLRTLADLIAGAVHNALSFQEAQEQAITDGLTGVKTHRFFMEALAAEWKRSTRAERAFSLVLIDLDHFKFVNDFHGHPEGDLVLTRVAQILEQNCRRSDVVARYGGDEFIILMPETGAEQGYQFAEKLCASIYADPLLRERGTSASMGIAGFPTQGSTPEELIQVADASMYLSKHAGGNAVSSAEHCDSSKTKKWKQDVLEAYLGVTLKRIFSTGPEAFQEIRARLQQFSLSLAAGCGEAAPPEHGAARIPPAVRETVTSLALAIDAKDHYTQGHSQKVASYAALLARRIGLHEHEIEQVHLGGLLHDIGKVGIPGSILNKSGPLNPEEWAVMKQHVQLGDELLVPLEAVERIRAMIRHHHEMFDGSGYPDSLTGELIPLGARIIAIADAYDTILSERAYKKARTPEAALTELERCAGTQFDPQLVQAFVEALQQPAPVEEPAEDSARPVAQ